MKDLLIAIAALLILTAVFSYGTLPEQTTPPDTHGDGTQTQGEGYTAAGLDGDTPTESQKPKPLLSVGDKVMLTADATVYGTAIRFAPWVYTAVLYVRQIDDTGRVVVSTQETGVAYTGSVDKKHLVFISKEDRKMSLLHLVWMLPLAALIGFVIGCIVDGID